MIELNHYIVRCEGRYIGIFTGYTELDAILQAVHKNEQVPVYKNSPQKIYNEEEIVEKYKAERILVRTNRKK